MTFIRLEITFIRLERLESQNLHQVRNNLHQVRKIGKSNNIKVFVRKKEGLNMIDRVGYQYLMEIYLSFNKNILFSVLTFKVLFMKKTYLKLVVIISVFHIKFFLRIWFNKEELHDIFDWIFTVEFYLVLTIVNVQYPSINRYFISCAMTTD
jgi:hypothetical protein